VRPGDFDADRLVQDSFELEAALDAKFAKIAVQVDFMGEASSTLNAINNSLP
ncbi:unnamed protein product, partial [Symbiodinium sp. CCMP2456]